MGKRYDSFKLVYFSKKNGEVNTIIGGVASVLDTPYKLAQKLEVSVSRIEGFRIVGDDIEFRVKGEYTLSRYFTTSSLPSLPNITKYDDKSGLVIINARQTFQNSSYLKWVSFPKTTTLGFYCFLNCTALEYVYVPKTETLTTNVNGGAFDGCSNPNIVADLSSVKTITGYYTFRNSGFKILELPSLEYIHSNTNNINDHFRNMTNLEKLSMRKLKTWTWIGTNYDLGGVKMNSLIEVHKELDTTEPLYPLIYAYCVRDAVVNFYNDSDEFVKTLEPTPNVEMEFIDNTFSQKSTLRTNNSFSTSGYWLGNYQYDTSTNTVNTFMFTKAGSGQRLFFNNTKIKKFRDYGGVLIGSAATMREMFLGATNLEVFESNSVQYLNNYVFQNTKITNLYLPSLIWIGANCFYGIPLVTRIECPLLETPLEGGNNQVASCPMLEEFVAPLLKYINQGFYQDCTSLKRAIHNEATYVRERAFFNCTSLELIEAKKCKNIGLGEIDNSNVFSNLKMGCNIHVHIDNKTNYNGGLNYDLAYAKDVRGAIIHFYDDELNLVETI